MTRHVLISGASSGIGKAAARALAERGIAVFAGALNDSEAQAMRLENVPGVVPVVLDVTSADSIESALRTVRQVLGSEGHLYGLINCAGVGINAPLHVLEEREVRQMVNVNYLGSILLTRAALPMMKYGSSRLLFISSAMALLRTPTISVYCSTKAGIEGFADAMRIELIPAGIQVAIVEPGVIRTPMIEETRGVLENKLLPRMGDIDRKRYEPMMRKIADLASDPKTGSSTEMTSKAIVHALTAAKPRIRYRVGSDSTVAAIIGNLPYGIQDWIQRKLYKL